MGHFFTLLYEGFISFCTLQVGKKQKNFVIAVFHAAGNVKKKKKPVPLAACHINATEFSSLAIAFDSCILDDAVF